MSGAGSFLPTEIDWLMKKKEIKVLDKKIKV